MYNRILVTLDGSSAAEIVLPYAVDIAVRSNAELILMSVSEDSAVDMDQLYRAYMEQLAEQVQRQLREWGAKKGARALSEMTTGKPAIEIVSYAEENNVGLIIIASHGSSGEKEWLLGNIASKVLQTANKPVLLIRAPASDEALKERKLVRRILLPLDTSRAGESAIPHAEALARLSGAELRLFHVLEPTPLPFVMAPGIQVNYPPVSADAEARRAASAIEYLQDIEEALKGRGLNASSEVGLGYPAGEIIKYAEANSIDLIAVSTHGRSGIERWVFGSVTEKLLQAGNKAILVVREAKE